MNIKNLTPHTLNIITDVDTGEQLVVSPSGKVARVEVESTDVDPVAGIPVVSVETGDIVGLPEPEEGYIIVVSGMVEAATGRKDVYSPGTLVRDEAGKPIGCKGLKQTAPLKVEVQVGDMMGFSLTGLPKGTEVTLIGDHGKSVSIT